MTAMSDLLCETPCPTCAATGRVDPTAEQVAAYALLPGTRLRCGTCGGTGATVGGTRTGEPTAA